LFNVSRDKSLLAAGTLNKKGARITHAPFLLKE
jgi:hypothetical protein